MTPISGFYTPCFVSRAKSFIPSPTFLSSSSSSVPIRAVRPQINGILKPNSVLVENKQQRLQKRRKIVRSVAEETLIPEEAEVDSLTTTTDDQLVSVQVSPSDVLTMFFQAEGTMNEMSVPTVTKALEATEGVTDLNVRIDEGIATVELTIQTTIQATGVASGLVEIIQGSGFKLQTLNLSFEDEDDII